MNRKTTLCRLVDGKCMTGENDDVGDARCIGFGCGC